VQRRQLDFRDFDTLAADVDRLHRDGYTKGGTWDLRQVCEHLTATMRMSIEGFTFKVPWWFTFLRPLIRRRLFKTRKMPAGIKGPDPLMPAATGEETAALNAFHKELIRIRDHPGPFQRSPVLGRLDPDEWRQFHLIHASHHLSFLIPQDAPQGSP
jgi:hypothetical protein